MKILIHIIRSIIGLVFIYSGFAKLYPIEPFELLIFDQNIFNFLLTTVIARVLIGLEIFLGLLLLVNIYTKTILRFTLVLLIGFTGFLAYLAIYHSDLGNCNCFGEHLAFTPLESIYKNLVLIGLSILLLYKNNAFKFRFRLIIVILALLGSFSTPFILNPPDPFVINLTEYESGYEFKYDSIEKYDFSEGDYNIKDGKNILCFFSTHCEFCKLAAQKISITYKNNDLKPNVYYFFLGEDADMEYFWEESKSTVFPHKIMNAEDFFQTGGLNLPAIFFVNKGVVEKKVGYRNLFDSDIVEFSKN